MDSVTSTIEKTAGYFIGFLAILTFTEAVLRYGFTSHIPDAFVLGKVLQGIAICWGIATATYADRHINVDVVYELAPAKLRRALDVIGYTFNLIFLTLFGYAITFKVFDILKAGEISNELKIPIWTGYTFASLGILAAVFMAAARWWQVVIRRRPVRHADQAEAA
jgi:TRAP-type C4-dicarboxylate transport system permease small subunit